MHSVKRGCILAWALDLDFDQLQPHLGSSLSQWQQTRFNDLAMIGQHCDAVHRRQDLTQQRETLDFEFRGDQRNARDIAARVRPTLGHASEDWVLAHWCGDNRDYARRCAGRMKRPIRYAMMASGLSPTSACASSGNCSS